MKRKTLIMIVSISGMMVLFLIGCSTIMPASKITTSAGEVIITKIEIAAKDPADNRAATGHKILLVWFEGANGEKISNFFEASENVYITGDDGSKTERYFGGIASGELVLGFTPPTTAQKFTLHWPDNPEIELVLPK